MDCTVLAALIENGLPFAKMPDIRVAAIARLVPRLVSRYLSAKDRNSVGTPEPVGSPGPGRPDGKIGPGAQRVLGVWTGFPRVAFGGK